MKSQRMTTPDQQNRPATIDDQTLSALTNRFEGPGVRGILLTGSYARGDAGPFSDVDLVRIVARGAVPGGEGSHLVDRRLVTVSNVEPAGVEAWFNEPAQIIDAVQSLREARILSDRDGLCAQIRQRAHNFRWTDELQRRADQVAGDALVGWIEEAFKGLEGLRRDDPGRLLNARFGLSWGLVHVMRVQRGILRRSDNDVLDAIAQALAPDTSWIATARRAFGIAGAPLRDQVTAGLHLYVMTAEPLLARFTPQVYTVLAAAIDTIHQELDTMDER